MAPAAPGAREQRIGCDIEHRMLIAEISRVPHVGGLQKEQVAAGRRPCGRIDRRRGPIEGARYRSGFRYVLGDQSGEVGHVAAIDDESLVIVKILFRDTPERIVQRRPVAMRRHDDRKERAPGCGRRRIHGSAPPSSPKMRASEAQANGSSLRCGSVPAGRRSHFPEVFILR